MKKIILHLKRFKIFLVIFICIIILIVLPNALAQYDYWSLFILISFSFLLMFIFETIYRYFSTMAINLNVNNKKSIFNFANGKSIEIEHKEVNYVKCNQYRYIFYLKNGKKIYLSRLSSGNKVKTFLIVEKEVLPMIKELYSDRIK